jgi:hypothetical protein
VQNEYTMHILYEKSNGVDFFKKYNGSNILVVDIRLNRSEYEWIFEQPHLKTMLFITEPIHYFGFSGGVSEYSYKAFNENKFTYIFGCINHDPKHGRYKYPLYMFIPEFDFKNKEYYNQINNNVKNTNRTQLTAKRFNALISRWDPGTRECIYERLITIDHIDCPGILFNNCSNEELNRIGKINYIQNYKFNICPENSDHDNVPGYITEKIMDCCLGGAIPIYAGSFDKYDAKILNANRIIFYNSKDEKSIEYAYFKVKFLMENPDLLLCFYNQPIFCDTAYDTVQELCNDFDKLIENPKDTANEN